jgi:hypothetical protein
MEIAKLVKNGIDFLMNSEFQRIKSGKRIGLNKEPYPIEIYDNLLKHFESTEEFEKCIEIRNQKMSILDHENNYINWNKN